jgi:hypothetical protein
MKHLRKELVNAIGQDKRQTAAYLRKMSLNQ